MEEVGALTKPIRNEDDPGAGDELDALLGGLDLDETIQLMRAFTSYFYLANVAEQVHRIEELAESEGANSLAATVDRVLVAELDPEMMARVVDRLELRPVFAAHPTEAARRTILTKLRTLADLLDRRLDPRATPEVQDRIDRRVAELIGQIWQTDELRLERPEPMDEARSMAFYFDQLISDVLPTLGEDAALQLRRMGGWRPRRQPLGHPRGNLVVLEIQHDRGLRSLITVVEEVAEELSTSDRIRPSSAELEASLADDRTHFARSVGTVRPAQRRRAPPSQMRLHPPAADQHPGPRPRGTRPSPGADYAGPADMMEELELVHRSLVENPGRLIAGGTLIRLMRNLAALGFQVATTDVREHSRWHRDALSQLYKRLDVDYESTDAKERTQLLAGELEGLRPLSSPPNSRSGPPRPWRRSGPSAPPRTATGPKVIESYVISMKT